MRNIIWWLIAAGGLGLVAAIFYFPALKSDSEPRPRPELQAPAVPAPPPALPAMPQIHYPVSPASQEKPLPALDTSDTTIAEALRGMLGGKVLEELFRRENFIRRIVATIDNLPREKIGVRFIPLKPAAGKFLTAGHGETLAISADNAGRYTPYVRLAVAANSAQLVSLYIHFYPLFQQAYRDLGYPKGYFNDRLIEVIDHLLAAPDMQLPVKLVQPKVFYQFADSALEARSAGQKILMRMGTENAAQLKMKLRELRSELTRPGPTP